MTGAFAWRRWWPGWWLGAGFLWVWLFVAVHWHPLEPPRSGKDWQVQGQIVDFPVRRAGGWRFDFRVMYADAPLPRRLRLSWYGGPPLHVGEVWQLTVRLKSPRGFHNPGGFDYERWLFARGIGATGYVRRSDGNRLLEPPRGIDALRGRLAAAIARSLDGSSRSGLVRALALGARDGISPAQWQVLRRTGTAHLVAISGLHIGLVAGSLLGLGRRLWLRFGTWRLGADTAGAALALLGALGYSALAGFSLPTQRALIMLATALAAWVWRRHASPWQGYSLALIGVCLRDPLAPLGSGFWLSFAAVAWILFVVANRLGRPRRWMGVLKVQAMLWLGMAPLLIYGFHQIGWSAPLANLVAIPLVGFVAVPLILAGCLVWWFWPDAAQALWHWAEGVLGGVWAWLAWLAQWSAGEWPLPAPTLIGVVLASVGLGLLAAPRGLPGRWLGALLLLPLLFPPAERPRPGQVWFTLLDVGQGLAVVVETSRHVLVYDTGPRFSDRFDAGSDIVAPFLYRRGRRHVDLVVVSHGDGDHRGGLAGLLRRFPSPVVTSDPEALGLPAAECRAGRVWRWDGVEFELLWPVSRGSGGGNDRSCVLKITAAGGASVLLPGDLEAGGEAALVARYGTRLAARVLVAPHHGSRTSSTPAFLDAVRPELILVAAGHGNRFGFPHPEVVARYRRRGRVLTTVAAGAIQVRLDRTVQVRSWRSEDRHLWSMPP